MDVRDSFDPAPTRDPGHVKKVTVYLSVEEEEDEDGVFTGVFRYTSKYEFGIPDKSGGSADFRGGKLREHLTPAEKTTLKKFMDARLTKAQGAGT